MITPTDTMIIVGIVWAVSLTGLFVAAVTDFKRRIIPNPLVILTIGCGIAIRLLADPESITLSLIVAAIVLLALGLVAHRKLIGGGDVKLITAVTLLVPYSQIGNLLLVIAIMGGALSCVYLLATSVSRRRELWLASGGHERRQRPRKTGWYRAIGAGLVMRKTIPYAVAVFGGTASFALSSGIRWLYAIS
jgi:prepilin peptidase CpaA